ncbi:MAG: DedA family protein [Patescibacteria group bacterium]
MLEILISYKYLILFPLATIEGPIVTVIAGFLAAQGMMNVYLVCLIVMAGDLVGDVLYYALGRWGRMGILDKWGKYIGFSSAKIKELEDHFVNHSGKTLLIGKLAHGIGAVFLTAAGLSKMPFGKFIFYNVIGTIPKSLVLLLVGFYFGSAYARINKYFDWLALSMFILAVAFLVIYLLILKFSKKIERDL